MLWKHFLIVLILKRYAVHFINNISQDRIHFTKDKVTPIYSLFQSGKSLAYPLNPIKVTIIGVEWRYTIAILIHSKCLNCSKSWAGYSNLHLIEDISTNNSNLADIDDKCFFLVLSIKTTRTILKPGCSTAMLYCLTTFNIRFALPIYSIQIQQLRYLFSSKKCSTEPQASAASSFIRREDKLRKTLESHL